MGGLVGWLVGVCVRVVQISINRCDFYLPGKWCRCLVDRDAYQALAVAAGSVSAPALGRAQNVATYSLPF